MVDLSDTGSSESEETNTSGDQTPDSVSSDKNQVKTCADCGTTKTRLWRGGPAGPKSLCNACGIRSRKKRRALLSLNKENKDNKDNNQSSSSPINGGNGKFFELAKRKLMSLGREVLFRRQISPSIALGKQWRKLREEEQAAFLLMAMSCGSAFV